MRRKHYIIIIILLSTLSVFAGRLKSGFQALEVYNYFKAKQKLEKVRKRHPVAANFGLSVIYLREDNPFHNIDSAYVCIKYSTQNYKTLTTKLKAKYADLSADSVRIYEQRDNVSNAWFKRALNVNSEFGYQDFINKHPWSQHLPEAITLRDSLFFEAALTGHKAKDFKAFMVKYPNSKFYTQARSRFEKQLYIEQTRHQDLASYINFIDNYPDSPFIEDAENKVFEIETSSKTIKSYEEFINTYSSNRNISKAWDELYQTFIGEHQFEDAISEFLERYPNTPFKKAVELELELSKTVFLPIRSDNVWGFINADNTFKIEASYDYVDQFSEGYAAVMIDDKIGYISKTGALKIPCQFDDGFAFNEGYAVVEQNEFYGLINRQGEFVVPAVYTDLGQMVDDRIPFQKDDLYGYFDEKGNVSINPVFTDAFNFENGIAKVSMDGKWGLIDKLANFIINPEYSNLKILKTDSVYGLEFNGKWGGLNLNSDTILTFDYDYIGAYSNGYYLVTRNDSFNYISDSGNLIFQGLWQPIYPEYKILAKYNRNPILVLTDGGYNYMKPDGQLIFKYGKETLSAYSNLIAFSKGDLWGYLSPVPAEEVIEPKYNAVKPFKNGLGIVSQSNLWGIINPNDEIVVPLVYNELKFLNDTILLANKNNKMGLLNRQGDTILPFIAGEIELYKESIVSISTKNSLSYFNLETSDWIKKESE